MQHGMPNGTLLIAKISSETWFGKRGENTIQKISKHFVAFHKEKLSGSECVYLFAGVWKWFMRMFQDNFHIIKMNGMVLKWNTFMTSESTKRY